MADIEIPKRLPISGPKGSEYLEKLNKRAQFLRKRIREARPKELSWDLAELGALEWAIRQIIVYEKLLKGVE